MATYAATTRFDFGRVIGDTFEVLSRNLVPFLLVALVLAGVPALVQTLVLPSRLSGVSGGAMAAWALGSLVFGIVKALLSFVMQGALVSGAIASLNGSKVDLGDMLARGLSAALPLLGLVILEVLGLMVGMVLLIVPFLILMVVWSVAVPSLVVERTGVIGAFGRSSDLTRGHRWAIFALMLVYGVLILIVTMIMGGVVGAFAGVTMVAGHLEPGSGVLSPIAAIFNAVTATVLGAVSAAGVAALYYHLRLIKEGVAPRSLLDTFN